jgi:hypothetical protein
MVIFQLLPFEILAAAFLNCFGFNICVGSVFNFKLKAYNRLAQYELWAKTKLRQSNILHSDETGMRISGKRKWLHVTANDKFFI